MSRNAWTADPGRGERREDERGVKYNNPDNIMLRLMIKQMNASAVQYNSVRVLCEISAFDTSRQPAKSHALHASQSEAGELANPRTVM